MKPLTKLLLIILALTSLIPFFIGIFCLFNHPRALEFFDLGSLTPGLDKILYVLGGFILATVVLPILAIYYLLHKKQEGFTLSLIAGIVSLGRGILTWFNFNSSNINDGKLFLALSVIGLIIILVTMLARNQYKKQFLS